MHHETRKRGKNRRRKRLLLMPALVNGINVLPEAF